MKFPRADGRQADIGSHSSARPAAARRGVSAEVPPDCSWSSSIRRLLVCQAFLVLPNSHRRFRVQAIGGAIDACVRIYTRFLARSRLRGGRRTFSGGVGYRIRQRSRGVPAAVRGPDWAHSLWDTWFRLVEPQDRHLDGLRHVRDRCHHQLAAAIYPDAAAPSGWRWYAIGHLPPEDVGRGHDREGAKNYTELLAQRPVLETLEIVERHFRSIVPEHEL